MLEVVLTTRIKIRTDEHDIDVGPSGIQLVFPQRELSRSALEFLREKLYAYVQEGFVYINLQPEFILALLEVYPQLRCIDFLAEFIDALLSTEPKQINAAVENLLRGKTA